jgi:hypothetical protein
VRPPGFEPGLEAWKASILDQTGLWPLIQNHRTLWLGFKIIDEMNHNGQVSGMVLSYKESPSLSSFDSVSGRLGSYRNPDSAESLIGTQQLVDVSSYSLLDYKQ